MATSTVNAKRRVVLPEAEPGEVFEIQSQGEGRLLLVRRSQPRLRINVDRCLEAMATAPLRPKMSWVALRALTREP